MDSIIIYNTKNIILDSPIILYCCLENFEKTTPTAVTPIVDLIV